MEDLLTISEVAELLKVSDRTVRNWIEKGTIKAYRFGLVYRIKKVDFDEFVKQSQVNFNDEKGE
jgi:excisionase family DNA binding protein